MSMIINVLIKGLAVCYREHDVWKIIFLCDDRHRLKYSQRKNGIPAPQKAIELRRRNREIYFDAVNTQPAEQPRGEGYEQIFNINSLYAHRGEIRLKPLAEIPAVREVVTMRIPDAQLYTAQPQPQDFSREKPYHIMIKDRPETETMIHITARIVGARIVLSPGGSIEIKGNDAKFPQLPPALYENGAEYDLIFDNDCGDDCGDDDDFQEYYDLLYDKSGLEFFAGRPPLMKVGLLTADGNCDPIVIDPPPV